MANKLPYFAQMIEGGGRVSQVWKNYFLSLEASSPSGFVPDTRAIATTTPLTGGGDLSANRTLGIGGLTGYGGAGALVGMNDAGTGWGYKALEVSDAGGVTADSLAGVGVRLVTSSAVGLLGNGTAVAGSYSFSGTLTASNLSGTNTGDQTITLTGDVTGSGTGVIVTTISAASFGPAVILAPASSTRNVVQPIGDFVPLVIRGSAGQTEDLLRIQNSASTAFVTANAYGGFFHGNAIASSGYAFQSRFNLASNARLQAQFENAGSSGDADDMALIVGVSTSSTTPGVGGGSPALVLRRGSNGNKEWVTYFNKSDNTLRWKYNSSGSATSYDATSLMTMTTSGALSLAGGDLTVSRSDAASVTIAVTNTNTGSAAHAMLSLSTAAGGGDPYILFYTNTAIYWSAGVDNSDGEKFKIGQFSSIGSTTMLVIDPSSKNTGIGLDAAHSTTLHVNTAANLSTVECRVQNNTNSGSTTNAAVSVVTGASAGDPRFTLTIDSTQSWSMGIDNSDSDAFVICRGTTIGSSVALKITTGDAFSIPSGTLTLDTSLAGTGTRLVTSTSGGLLGNATTIAGAYTWSGAAVFSSTLNVTGTPTLPFVRFNASRNTNPTPANGDTEIFTYDDGAGYTNIGFSYTDGSGITRFSSLPLGSTGGGQTASSSAKNADFTLEHGGYGYRCDAGALGITVTLPAGLPGDVFAIKKTAGAGTVTLSAGSASIDGASSHPLTTLNSSVLIQSDGTDWYILAAYL